MTRQEFRELVQKKRVVLDGATGSNLQEAGMPAGVCPEQWILEHKEILIRLQQDYLEAGTDILYAPTFSANRIKLAEYGLEDQLLKMNEELIKLTKEAIYRAGKEGQAFAAADLTMTGQQLVPIGSMQFEELVNIYKEQISCAAKAGADLIVVETMMSLQECRAALLAVKETCSLPVMITLTFKEDGRTLYGTAPETAAVVLERMGADAVGLNCSAGPDKILPMAERMLSVAGIPVIVKPNAGLPMLKDGKTVYDMDAQTFACGMDKILALGAGIVGGCCGTTPEHIRRLAQKASCYAPVTAENKHLRVLSTERNILSIDLDGRFLVIGERINPTGKKALQEELRNGSLELVKKMAEEQVENGADILDINMGMNGIDEKEMMLKAIEELSGLVNVPLCIDSSYPKIIEEALRRYPGRALINSISMEKEKLEQLLPAAKKYGAMFILLPLSKEGMPKDLNEKKQIIDKILAEAEKQGLNKEDILVDGLVNTIGANKDAAVQALETIRYCREELGVATMCGLSNISFGLPERQFVNAAFLSFAIQAGITMAIVNPSQDLLMNMAFASDLLKNKAGADSRYISRATQQKLSFTRVQEGTNQEEIKSASQPVFEAVLKGNRKNIVSLVQKELEIVTPSDILNRMLIPAINEVGELFNNGKYFLPQLIAAAEAMKAGIEFLEPLLQEGRETKKSGVVVIATVEGDIHDIGKNLVALMLKNYGFEVIDLGKDVSAEEIIRAAQEKDADIIAVSALMTTTMTEMKRIVTLRDQTGIRAKIMIGGAVITQNYCDEIHADGYSKDAQEAVAVAKKLIAGI